MFMKASSYYKENQNAHISVEYGTDSITCWYKSFHLLLNCVMCLPNPWQSQIQISSNQRERPREYL